MNLMDKKWLKSVKILYVEDEIDVQTATVESLEAIFDTIVPASNGEEALELFTSHGDFDIIVTDINMPKMNGIELSIKIREINTSFPITIITAHTEREFLQDSINLNINGYTLKPVNLKNLVITIAQAVEGRMLRKELEKLNSSLVDQLREKTFELNSILNSQETIVVVLKDKNIHTVNTKFLEFIGKESLDDFNNEYIQDDKSIEKVDSYYTIQNYSQFASLTQYRSNIQNDIMVKIRNNHNVMYVFKLNITTYEFNGIHYVLTFSDVTMLNEQADILKYQANHDNLTNLYNRQKFNEVLSVELNRNIRYNHDFVVTMFDIDLFKNINDTYGHDIGDKVLINLSSLVKRTIRDTDTVARWGGEEFMILFPETNLDDGLKIIEKLRENIEKAIFSSVINSSITCSFGVTIYQKNDTFDTILKRVDIALYEAKNSGRNRIEKYIS